MPPSLPARLSVGAARSPFPALSLRGVVALLGLAAIAVGQTEAPPKPISMADAVRQALAQHPSLAAAEHRVQAARHRAGAAAAFPNPQLTWTPFWGSADVGGSDEEFILAQPLDIQGRRRHEQRAARAHLSGAEASSAAARNDLVFSVKAAYIDVLLAREIVSLNGALRDTAQRFRDAAQKRFDSGDLARIEVDRATLELDRAEQELVRSRVEVAMGEAELNTWLGNPPGTPLVLADSLMSGPLTVDESALVEKALQQRPELAEAEAELATRKAEVGLAASERKPDLVLEGRRNQLSGGANALLLTMTVPLLDHGSIRDEVKAARADVAEQECACEELRREITLDVETALLRVHEAREQIRTYEDDILPRTELITQTIQKGFDAGASGILDVLDAQRTRRSVQSEYREATADYLRAVANLQRAAGEQVSADLPE